MKATTINSLKNKYLSIKAEREEKSENQENIQKNKEQKQGSQYKMHPNQYWASPHFFFHIPGEEK